jgi:ribosome maturation factor RimP
MTASRDKVFAVVEPVVSAAGYDLEDLTVMAAGRRRLVKAVVDRDAGVDLDDAAAVSRAISATLDDTEVMGETPYVLEVTSPGVDRPLTLPRHWSRARSRLVKVDRVDGTQVLGRVVSAGDESAVLTLGPDDAATEVEVAYREVAKAVMQVEFNRPKGVPADGGIADDDDLADDDIADNDSADADITEATGRG